MTIASSVAALDTRGRAVRVQGGGVQSGQNDALGRRSGSGDAGAMSKNLPSKEQKADRAWPPLVDALWNIADELRRKEADESARRDKSEASDTVVKPTDHV